MGAPRWPPSPPTFVAPRRSRGAPLYRYAATRAMFRWGPEMTPKPPDVRRAPAEPWRSIHDMGAPAWPPNPQRSERPGRAVALLYIAAAMLPQAAREGSVTLRTVRQRWSRSSGLGR